MYGTCGRIDNKADFDFDMSSTKENKAKDKSIEISDNNTVTIYLQTVLQMNLIYISGHLTTKLNATEMLNHEHT